jgi:hypothetical protein
MGKILAELPAWKQAQLEQKLAMRRLNRPLVWGKGITADLGIRRYKRAHPEATFAEILKIKDERWNRIAPPGVKI